MMSPVPDAAHLQTPRLSAVLKRKSINDTYLLSPHAALEWIRPVEVDVEFLQLDNFPDPPTTASAQS